MLELDKKSLRNTPTVESQASQLVSDKLFAELDNKHKSDLARLETTIIGLKSKTIDTLPDIADFMSSLKDAEDLEDLRDKIDHAIRFVVEPFSKFQESEKKVTKFFAKNPNFSEQIQSEITQNILSCQLVGSFSEFLDFGEYVNNAANFLDDFNKARIQITKNRANFTDNQEIEIKSIAELLKDPKTTLGQAKEALKRLNSLADMFAQIEVKHSVDELFNSKIQQLKDKMIDLSTSNSKDKAALASLKFLYGKLSLLEEAVKNRSESEYLTISLSRFCLITLASLSF